MASIPLFPARQEILDRRQQCVGRRVRLILMADDPHPIEPGAQGVVGSVDDIGTLHVDWDDGRRLGLVTGEDEFELI